MPCWFLWVNSRSTVGLYIGRKEIFLPNTELDVAFLTVEKSILLQRIECDGWLETFGAAVFSSTSWNKNICMSPQMKAWCGEVLYIPNWLQTQALICKQAMTRGSKTRLRVGRGEIGEVMNFLEASRYVSVNKQSEVCSHVSVMSEEEIWKHLSPKVDPLFCLRVCLDHCLVQSGEFRCLLLDHFTDQQRSIICCEAQDKVSWRTAFSAYTLTLWHCCRSCK